MSKKTDEPVDVDEAPDAESFDAAAWLSGATSTVRSVTVYGRADLVAEIDELDRLARIARQVPDEDRSLGDPSPEGLEERREDVYRQWAASALTIRVEGRSDDRRAAIVKRLKKDGVTLDKDGNEETLHFLADAVQSPEGLDSGWFRAFRDKSESQYRQVVQAYVTASGAPPVVTLPFFGDGSRSRRQGTSS